MKTLIAIASCHRYRERANVLRRTWVPDVANRADVRFFLGDVPAAGVGFPPPDDEVWNDEVWLNVPDDYKSLRLKVQRMFGWSVEQGYDFIFKVDDDIYVIPDRLFANFSRHDYKGRVRGPSGSADLLGMQLYGAGEVCFCSGFAYWVSRRAAAIIAQAPDNGDWAEDRFAANALARGGIRPIEDRTFKLWPGVYLHSPCRTDGLCSYCATAYLDASVVCPHERPDLLEPMHTEFKATGRIFTLVPAKP